MDIFGLDKILFKLIDGSGFTLLIFLGILKILAKETKWSGDDKIVGMLLGIIRTRKNDKSKSDI